VSKHQLQKKGILPMLVVGGLMAWGGVERRVKWCSMGFVVSWRFVGEGKGRIFRCETITGGTVDRV